MLMPDSVLLFHGGNLFIDNLQPALEIVLLMIKLAHAPGKSQAPRMQAALIIVRHLFV